MIYHSFDRASDSLKNAKYVIVGAGFYGSVVAERIANDMKERVVIIEKRNHIGGNSSSHIDEESGIECHSYGSHIFHTSNKIVWEYINNFCAFNNYRHKVLTQYKGKIYQLPINLSTINAFYGKTFTPDEAEAFLMGEIAKENIQTPASLEEKAISLIGRPLYEAFIKGYSIKQWETDPKELPASTITRLPVRYNYKAEYFNDPWQGIPFNGYDALFKRLLDSSNIELHLNADYFNISHYVPDDCLVIYTGPADRFFNYKFGKLGWRTLQFEKNIYNTGDFQGTSVMNYAEASTRYTRIHEFRHYHEERLNYPMNRTVIYREYSAALGHNDDPYYPINTENDRKIFKLYEEEIKKHPNVIFGGRLGTYKYLDMDQSIAQALGTYERKIKVRRRS